MALRDTLVRLKRQQEDAVSFQADKAQMRDEWIGAVSALVDEIRTFLQAFEADGGLVFSEQDFMVTEELLGTYSARGATIEAGPAKIELRPVARVVVGGLGRVDLTRQGYPRSSDRVLILRFEDEQSHSIRWHLRLPTGVGVAHLGDPLHRTREFDFLPLEPTNIERAFDFLLNR